MGSTGNFMAIMQTIASNFYGLHTLLMDMAALIGLIFVVLGVFRFARNHRYVAAGDGVMSPLYPLVGGSLLLSLTFTMQTLTTTVFQSPSSLRTSLAYSAPNTGNQTSALLTVLVGFITIFGWFAVVRGLVILATMANARVVRDGGIKKVIVLISAGTLCANFVFFTEAISSTFGIHDYLLNYVPL